MRGAAKGINKTNGDDLRCRKTNISVRLKGEKADDN